MDGMAGVPLRRGLGTAVVFILPSSVISVTFWRTEEIAGSFFSSYYKFKYVLILNCVLGSEQFYIYCPDK